MPARQLRKDSLIFTVKSGEMQVWWLSRMPVHAQGYRHAFRVHCKTQVQASKTAGPLEARIAVSLQSSLLDRVSLSIAAAQRDVSG